MDDTVFVMFLLTGFCVPLCPSSPNVYYFIRGSKDWLEAQLYCTSEYTSFAQIKQQDNITALMNHAKVDYNGKAWIGVRGMASEKWTWVDEQPATYFNWNKGQPDSAQGEELCVIMSSEGGWDDLDCLQKKAALCYNGSDYIMDQKEMTWNDSKTYCERKNSNLAKISDKKAISEIQHLLPQGSVVWIGLKKPIIWYWSTSEEIGTITNWQTGEPDMLTYETVCVAMSMRDGTWTDESCKSMYPFICQGSEVSDTHGSARKRVVKMKIQSTANMEDPVNSENLQKQLHAALAKQGVSDFQLTWKKLPVKQKEGRASEENC